MRSEFFILANVNKPQCCANARQKKNSAGESGNSINRLIDCAEVGVRDGQLFRHDNGRMDI